MSCRKPVDISRPLLLWRRANLAGPLVAFEKLKVDYSFCCKINKKGFGQKYKCGNGVRLHLLTAKAGVNRANLATDAGLR